MASPFWTDPGVAQGRVEPPFSSATEGDYAYILGFDGALDAQPVRLLNIGDTVSVEQNFDVSGRDFLSFSVEGTVTPLLPQTLLSGACEFKSGNLVAAGDALLGVVLGTAAFTEDMIHRVLRVSGTGLNNGDLRVSAVPMDQGIVKAVPGPGELANGRVAVLEPAVAVVDEAAPAATIRLLGARFVLRVYLDGVLLYTLREPHTNGPIRLDHRINVSKINGVHLLRFEGYLEEVA